MNRELVDSASPYKFGSYLYVTGGDDYPKNSLYRFGAGLKPPDLTVHPPTDGKIVETKRTPLGIEIRLTSTNVNTPAIETDIFLPDAEKQILLTVHLHKDRVLTRESAYIAFPFAVDKPQFTYGSQSAWVNPAKDELPGGSREWYLPTTFAAVFNSQVSAAVVPLDAPLMNFGDVMRGNWPAEFNPRSSTVFSWLMNNYWGTNFPAWQGGDFTFRYAITSAATVDAPALTRFAWNALTPLERDDVAASTDKSLLPAEQASLLEIDNPAVTLLDWKRAEDGNGTILRIQESGGKAGDIAIQSSYLQFVHAWSCDLLEDNQSELRVQGDTLNVSIKPFQVLTLRILTEPRSGAGGHP